MLKLFLVDDHALIRQGLSQMLGSRVPPVEIVEAATCREAKLRLSSGYKPDVTLLDLSLPDCTGTEAVSTLKRSFPDLAILVLTMHDETLIARSAIAQGALGFLTKSADVDSLMFAIKNVARGKKYYDPSIIEHLIQATPNRPSTILPQALSRREEEILLDLASGLSLQEIADRLGISRKTVSTYKARIMEKKGFKSNADLIRYTVLKDF